MDSALITSRSFRLPESAEQMKSWFWFNLWQKKLWPWDELQPGCRVFWYETPSQKLVWDSRLVRVERFEYTSRENAVRQLKQLFGEFDERQPLVSTYVSAKSSRGFCLAYTVGTLKRISVPKPDGFRFPQRGWLQVDDSISEWITV